MDNTKLYVGVHMEMIDGKYHYHIDVTKGMNLKEIQSVLVGGLNLSIRGEKTPELQGQTLREIISHMESEFVSAESFNEMKVNV